MKPGLILTASAALTLWSLVPAVAAPRSASLSTNPEQALVRIDSLCSEAAETAYRLNHQTTARDPEAHLDGLLILRADINRIGGELLALEAERGSLAPWEAGALDEILPLLHDSAVNADQAIRLYNADRWHLFSTPYGRATEKIERDTSKVAARLHDYLNLEKTRGEESKIEESLGEER
jgi:hypothetical protein